MSSKLPDISESRARVSGTSSRESSTARGRPTTSKPQRSLSDLDHTGNRRKTTASSIPQELTSTFSVKPRAISDPTGQSNASTTQLWIPELASQFSASTPTASTFSERDEATMSAQSNQAPVTGPHPTRTQLNFYILPRHPRSIHSLRRRLMRRRWMQAQATQSISLTTDSPPATKPPPTPRRKLSWTTTWIHQLLIPFLAIAAWLVYDYGVENTIDKLGITVLSVAGVGFGLLGDVARAYLWWWEAVVGGWVGW